MEPRRGECGIIGCFASKQGTLPLKQVLSVLAAFFVLSGAYLFLAYAASFSSTVSNPPTPATIVQAGNTNQLFNFSVNNTDSSKNITQVNITLPSGFNFITNSNGTSASSTGFSNTTTATIWSNTTSTGFIANGAVQYFWLNASVPSTIGNYSFNVSTLDTAGVLNWTLVNVTNYYPVASCQNLNISGMAYLLTTNASNSGTCFNILADNITLDGQGYWVNYSQSATGYGVNITSRNNITVKNLNIVQGNSSVLNAYAIYGTGMSGSTIVNNAIRTGGNSSDGIAITASGSNSFSGNNISVSGTNSSGFRLTSSASNTITGGSIASSAYYDYYLINASNTNNFTNTNFTAARNIYFNDSASYFNYNNGTGSIWLNTNVSAQGNITRTLLSWNSSLMQWNDTNSTAGITANYVLIGLIPSTTYAIYNTSNGVQTKPYNITTDSNGNLNFTIALNGSTGIIVDRPPNITVASPLSGGYYSTNWIWANVTLDKQGSWCGVSLNGTANLSLNVLVANTSWSLNLSVPTEGTNNVTFYCNDTIGSMGNTSAILFTKDTLPPVFTGIGADTITSSSARIFWTTNDNSSSIVSYGTSAALGLNATPPGNATSHSVSLAGLTASTTYYYNVSSCDLAGNCNMSAQYNFNTSAATTTTTPASAATASGGDSSSGASNTWQTIAAGAAASMSVTSSSVDVTYVGFTPSQALSNVKLTVLKLSAKPSDVSAPPPGTPYEYVTFVTENITDSQISSATIAFKVNATWLSQNNLDSSTVTLYRYSGGAWTALATSPAKGSTSDFINYAADTPGFSYFAISAQPMQGTAVQAPAPQTALNASRNITTLSNTTSSNNQTASGSFASSKSKILIILLILVIVFIISALVYNAKPKQDKKPVPDFKPSHEKKGDLVYKKPEKEEKAMYAYKPK